MAKPEDPSDFWNYLTRQGGNWMWEGLVDKHRHDDLTWLVEGLQEGTIEWCTDGSYHRGRAPNVSGAGWMCCDTAPVEPGEMRKALKGNFWEKSDSANSYRAEQLGVCAVHHLICALTSFYKIKKCMTKIWYDNMGAVNISKNSEGGYARELVVLTFPGTSGTQGTRQWPTSGMNTWMGTWTSTCCSHR